uniref:Uncharacterized protein n=1 Tax=Arundo donax TaxID=35708 RepID=A0A0A9HS20_ARUDO
MMALPGTSRAMVGKRPLKSPRVPPSDLSTCLATSIGPPYFAAAAGAATVAAAAAPPPAPAAAGAGAGAAVANALWACNLHLISSVGHARNETATPAPAPATTCWPAVSGTPGSDRSTASICPLTVKRTALKAATVARGAPMPLYRPRGPSAASVCLTASTAPA